MDALQPRLLLFPAVLLPALALSAALAIAAGEVQPAVGVNEAMHPTAFANWHQAAFDSAHTAHNRLETVLTPSNVGQLTQVWASQVGTGALYASPVVARGKVFIGSGDGRMYAFDATTGATLWIGEQQNLFFVDSAAAGHGLVFANSLYQTLLAYNADTGEIAWTSDLTDVRASPTFHGRMLYVASFDGRLTALNPRSGTPVWSVAGNCCVYDQAPVVDGGRVFQMRTDGTLTAYDAQTGAQFWSKPAFSVGTQAASHGMLFFNHYPNLVALDAATGDELWTAPVILGATPAAPAVANGLVFVTMVDLIALDAATGAEVWRAPGVHSTWGPTVANGVVYASNLSGEWDAFDERDGSLLWSVTVGSGCGGTCTNAVPVIANGTLYLAGPDQYLRAFSLPTEANRTGLTTEQEK